MNAENNIIGILKSVGIVLLIPVIFLVFMGPMKLAEMYPDYRWIRYSPLVLLLIPGLIIVFEKKSNK